MTVPAPSVADMIRLVPAADLAKLWGYSGPNDAFRVFCNRIGVTHVPGRPGWYDPRLVRRRMDEAQGLVAGGEAGPVMSLVEQRRARRGAA